MNTLTCVPQLQQQSPTYSSRFDLDRIDGPMLLTMRPNHDAAATDYFDVNLVTVRYGPVAIGIEGEFAAGVMVQKALSGNPLTEQNVVQWLHETYQAAFYRHVATFPLIPAEAGYAEGREWINNRTYGFFIKLTKNKRISFTKVLLTH
jgi:hypothetical protein